MQHRVIRGMESKPGAIGGYTLMDIGVFLISFLIFYLLSRVNNWFLVGQVIVAIVIHRIRAGSVSQKRGWVKHRIYAMGLMFPPEGVPRGDVERFIG